MGGWIGGQADYVMVPYADFNLLKFPDKAHAMEKIRDLTCHTWDRLPIAEIVNVKVIDLEQAPEGYESFDAGVASKFVIDPHGQLSKAA